MKRLFPFSFFKETLISIEVKATALFHFRPWGNNRKFSRHCLKKGNNLEYSLPAI
jgi:hypothetical protein